MVENCGYLSNMNAFPIYAIGVAASHTPIGIANYGLKVKVLCSRSPNITVHGYVHHLLHHLRKNVVVVPVFYSKKSSPASSGGP